MMLVALMLWIVVVVESKTEILFQNRFRDFKLANGKVYANEQEERLRLETFSRNLQEIEEHNRLYERGLKSWYMGVNQFTDMTPEEFAHYLTMQGPPPDMSNATLLRATELSTPAPVSRDWRKAGIITRVKNQGTCGACWSFSTVGAVEAALANDTGKLVALSEQNLVDCDRVNDGCKGGTMAPAFLYVMYRGLAKEADYAYEEAQGRCRADVRPYATVERFYTVLQNEPDLQVVVGLLGPVSAGVDATEFHNYAGGILSPNLCPSPTLNHAVLVVGYGNEGGVDYWLIKNSWGAAWGEKGYIRIGRNGRDCFGITRMTSIPALAGYASAGAAVETAPLLLAALAVALWLLQRPLRG